MRNPLYILSMLGIAAISLAVPCPVSAQHNSSASEQKKAQPSAHQAKDWWKEGENDPITIVRLHLHVPFSVRKGQLAVCMLDGMMLPISEGVFLVSSTPPHLPSYYPSSWRNVHWARCLFEVKNLNDLRGYVSIQTPQQALAYVRMLTFPRTSVCFPRLQPGLKLEVVSQDTVTSDFMFGDQREVEFVKSGGNGWCGVLDRKWVKRYPGLFATCIRSQDGFLVKRTLLVEEWDKFYEEQYHLEHVEEWVGQDGRYMLQKHARLPASATPDVYWHIPKRK